MPKPSDIGQTSVPKLSCIHQTSTPKKSPENCVERQTELSPIRCLANPVPLNFQNPFGLNFSESSFLGNINCRALNEIEILFTLLS
jgi:hypothetical protein